MAPTCTLMLRRWHMVFNTLAMHPWRNVNDHMYAFLASYHFVIQHDHTKTSFQQSKTNIMEESWFTKIVHPYGTRGMLDIYNWSKHFYNYVVVMIHSTFYN